MMKAAAIFLGMLFVTGASGSSSVQQAKVTPVQKIIQLMEGMVVKGEEEKHAEQVQFAAYSKWCKETSVGKFRAINEATEAIQNLKADIEKYTSDAAFLKRSIARLDEDISDIENDMKVATKARGQEHAEFLVEERDIKESVEQMGTATETVEAEAHDSAQAGAALAQVSKVALLDASDRKALSAFLAMDEEDRDAAEFSETGAPAASAHEFASQGVLDMFGKLGAKFEAKLAHGICADAVSVWSEYVRWVAEHQPKDKLWVVERACAALTSDVRCHGDIRLLRLWCRFAMVQNKVDNRSIFEFLENRGIGTRHALLYEAWATALEAKHDFVQAESVYRKGLERRAEPLDRLRGHLSDFQWRQAKHPSRKGISDQVQEVPRPLSSQSMGEAGRRTGVQPPAPILEVPLPSSLPATHLTSRSHATTRLLLTTRKKVAASVMAAGVGRSIAMGSTSAEAPQSLSEGHWISRKVPAGRSVQGSVIEEIAMGDGCQIPAKRRRLGAWPLAPLSAIDSSSQAGAKGEAPPQALISSPVKLGLEVVEATHDTEVGGSWAEGLAAIGEKMLEERDAKADEDAAQSTVVPKDDQATQSATPSSWHIASWLPWRKRT